MDPIIRNYLERAVEILLASDAESLLDDMEIDPIAYDRGDLSAVMRFSGGWRLSVHMRLELRGSKAILQRYSSALWTSATIPYSDTTTARISLGNAWTTSIRAAARSFAHSPASAKSETR